MDSERISEKYARFYAPAALGSTVLAFLPLFEDVEVKTGSSSFSTAYGTIFDMAGRPGGSPAIMGLLLLGLMIALLVGAVFWAKSATIPATLASVAGLIAMMLATKPGTGDPAPDLTTTGRAGLVLSMCVLVISTVHAVHLAVAGRTGRSPSRPGNTNPS